MNVRRLFLMLIVLVEWFALIAQLIIHLQTIPADITESLIRFFSYFTILTNILVAIYVTALFLAPANRQAGFFFSPSVQTAITLYIVVVGLIYNIILRQLWDSHGLQAVLHDLLHTAAPLLVLIFWWRWINVKNLQFSNIPPWLIYPAVYATLILLRGHTPGWYPYPFLDAHRIGYVQVLINSAGLMIVFLVFSFLFVFVGKKKTLPR
jgi:hypothetical protein